jgi:hypothetical protein
MDFTLYEATTKHSTKTMAVGTKEWWNCMTISLMIFYIQTQQHFNLCRESWHQSNQWNVETT